MAITRTVIPQKPTLKVNRQLADSHGARDALTGTARVVTRSVVKVALAAFAIFVLLPAVVAAQAAVSI